jgi:hypothetical protein
MFQDPGPLENDPLILALLELATIFPLAGKPDFMVSLGTGAPRANNDKPSMLGPLRLWKDGPFPRLCRMFWERMCDKPVKQIFRTHPRYHRLDTEFDGALLRLDNTKSIHKLQLKAQEDQSITKVIDNIARCAICGEKTRLKGGRRLSQLDVILKRRLHLRRASYLYVAALGLQPQQPKSCGVLSHANAGSIKDWMLRSACRTLFQFVLYLFIICQIFSFRVLSPSYSHSYGVLLKLSLFLTYCTCLRPIESLSMLFLTLYY